MHSRVDLLLADERAEAELVRIAGQVSDLVDGFEQMGNCYSPHSQVSAYNADPTQEGDGDLHALLELCRYYREQTFGLFNPWFEGRCNLSAILKGYALDHVCQLLTACGLHDAVVSMGNSSILYLRQGRVLTTSGNDSPTRRHIVNPLTGQLVVGQRILSVETPLVAHGPDGRPLSGGALGEVLSTALFIADDDQQQMILQCFPDGRIVS